MGGYDTFGNDLYATGGVIVFGAGTLSTPFTAELAAFGKQNAGVTIHWQFGASGDMVKHITSSASLPMCLALPTTR